MPVFNTRASWCGAPVNRSAGSGCIGLHPSSGRGRAGAKTFRSMVTSQGFPEEKPCEQEELEIISPAPASSRARSMSRPVRPDLGGLLLSSLLPLLLSPRFWFRLYPPTPPLVPHGHHPTPYHSVLPLFFTFCFVAQLARPLWRAVELFDRGDQGRVQPPSTGSCVAFSFKGEG